MMLLLLPGFLLVVAATGSGVLIELDDGSKISGFANAEGVQTFLGIPYAKPPVKDRRFKDSQPIGPVTVNATAFGNECMQKPMPGPVPHQLSEDCLFLNIYSPNTTGTHPVMFWIHGGGFTIGSGNNYVGNAFAKRGIVLVNINYRLGAFGFLYDGTENAPGNMGLKDQLLALKWVNQNIKKFGGNPEEITVFGESAGAGSASFHVLSPMSKGLFQRVILESATALGPGFWRSADDSAQSMEGLASMVPCSDGLSGVECLVAADANDIVQATAKLSARLKQAFVFIPSTDGSFVTDDPKNLVHARKYNDVDMIVGYNKNEAWMSIPMSWPDFNKLSNGGNNPNFATTDEIYEDGMREMMWRTQKTYQQSECLQNLTIFTYSQWDPPTTPRKRADAICDFTSDAWFKVPVIEFAIYAPGKVYLYDFTYVSEYSLGFSGKLWMGAKHSDEITFVFGLAMGPFGSPKKPSEADKRVANTMNEFWSNFAKTGDPNSPSVPSGATAWPIFNATSDQQYIVLDGSSNKTETYPRWKAYRFIVDYQPIFLQQNCSVEAKAPKQRRQPPHPMQP